MSSPKAHAEQPAQPDPDVAAFLGVGHPLADPVGQLGRGGLRQVVLRDAEPLAHDLGQGPERRALAVRQAAAAVPADDAGEPVGVVAELPAEPGLAHPGRSGHEDQPGDPTVDRGVEQLADRAHLGVPPGERRLQAVDALRTADAGHHPDRAPELLRLGLALERVGHRAVERDGVRRETPGRRVHQHLAGGRHRLHSRGGVHGVARDHPLVGGADRHRDLPGDDARAGRQVRRCRGRCRAGRRRP